MANYIYNREAVNDLYSKVLFYGADESKLKKLYHATLGTLGEFYDEGHHDLIEGCTIDVYYVPKNFDVEKDDFDDLSEEHQEVQESYRYDEICVPIDSWDYWNAEGYEAKEPEAEWNESIEYSVEVIDKEGKTWCNEKFENEDDWIESAAYYWNDATPILGDKDLESFDVRLHANIYDDDDQLKEHKEYTINIGHYEDFTERIGKIDNYKLCLQETK